MLIVQTCPIHAYKSNLYVYRILPGRIRQLHSVSFRGHHSTRHKRDGRLHPKKTLGFRDQHNEIHYLRVFERTSLHISNIAFHRKWHGVRDLLHLFHVSERIIYFRYTGTYIVYTYKNFECVAHKRRASATV